MYRDPEPNPELFGWGKKHLQAQQNLVLEARSIEKLNDATGIVCSTVSSTGATQEFAPEMEKLIRSKFKFDKGWDFRVAEQMLYKALLTFFQNIGNCVGASHAMLIAARIAHEVFAVGDAEDPLGQANLAIPFVPYSYGVGRLVGGMLGPGDGSYCGAQIEGTMKYGFLPCFIPGLEKYAGSGSDGLPQGTASAGRLFGKSKNEIEKWTDKAAEFKLLEAPKCTSADDLIIGVTEKYIPYQICSGQGFAFSHKDKNGINVYIPSGRWSHSMQIVAVFMINGQWYVTVRNQWGPNAHKDGMTFDITIETFAKWVRSAECIGIGSIQGLPSNTGF